MIHSIPTSKTNGLLDVLERYVRNQLNVRSIVILLTALAFCILQFVGRSQILKKVPDKHFPWISHNQLKEFILNPASADDERDTNNIKLKTPSLATSSQQPAVKSSDPARRFQLYYAATEATTDVAFPLVYGTLAGVLLWMTFGREGRWTLLLPLTFVSWDLIENATMIWLSLSFACSPSPPCVPVLATWPTSIKWGFISLAILVMCYGLIKKRVGGSASPSGETH